MANINHDKIIVADRRKVSYNLTIVHLFAKCIETIWWITKD